MLLAHYNAQINERRAKHQKWMADINWLEYAEADKTSNGVEGKFDLEKQILINNLRDLEQGVLWQWPQKSE